MARAFRIDRHRIESPPQGVVPMKRLIAVAMLSLFAAILLGGCHKKNSDVKPVSSAVGALVPERSVV